MASVSQTVKNVKVPLCSGLKWEMERISGACLAITPQFSTETPSMRKPFCCCQLATLLRVLSERGACTQPKLSCLHVNALTCLCLMQGTEMAGFLLSSIWWL